MQKKTLAVACIAALGMTGGIGSVYAQEAPTLKSVCGASDGAVEDISNTRCETLSVKNGGTAMGHEAIIAGPGGRDDVVVSGGNVDLKDASITVGRITVDDNASFKINGGNINVQDHMNIEGKGSKVDLDNVVVAVGTSGISITRDADFNMVGGSVSGSAGNEDFTWGDGQVVHVYDAQATFKGGADGASKIESKGDQSIALGGGGGGVIGKLRHLC